MIEVITGVIILFFILIACITDIKYRKIKNWNILLLVSTGLVLNFYKSGFASIVPSLLGGLVCIFLTIFLYYVRALGAGDIKLLGALGMVFGVVGGFKLILYSFIAGGFIALLYMIVNRNFISRFQNLFSYFKSILLTGNISSYQQFNDLQEGSHFAFSLAILVGFGFFYQETIF